MSKYFIIVLSCCMFLQGQEQPKGQTSQVGHKFCPQCPAPRGRDRGSTLW